MNITNLKQRAYVPYSEKPDAAVVQSSQGAWFGGVRVENISFPLTISAVQNALFCCLSEGHTPATLFVDDKNIDAAILHFWEHELSIACKPLEALDSITLHPIIKQLDKEQIASSLNTLLDHTRASHSNFPVSALLETAEGFITGINIEMNDWSKGLCAERVALAKALSLGIHDFTALHICTRDGQYNSPCGACRQVITEHLPHHPVYFHHADGTKARHFSSDLLPYSFQSSSLKKP